MNQEASKQLVGTQATVFVKENMVIGLGSGTTVSHFINSLGLRCQSGLNIQAVATSARSYQQALKNKIPLIDIDQISAIDLTVDGADEIDPQKWMIKGGGGALLREKIVASMSQEIIIIVDESKIVPYLGNKPVPVEIISFGYLSTIHRLKQLGYQGVIKKKENSSLYLTENQNYIYEIDFSGPIEDPLSEHIKLISILGVVETGFFFNPVHKVITGFNNGSVLIQ